jgi:hypothetical protein
MAMALEAKTQGLFQQSKKTEKYQRHRRSLRKRNQPISDRSVIDARHSTWHAPIPIELRRTTSSEIHDRLCYQKDGEIHSQSVEARCEARPRSQSRPTRHDRPGVRMAVDQSLQRNLNGQIHDWYRIIHGFPDRLVQELLFRFSVKPGQLVLDPFCGSGTTLVECMKRGIDCIGIDSNPSSCFSARVKTNWSLNPDRLLELAGVVAKRYELEMSHDRTYEKEPTHRYLTDSGMISRKWISSRPLKKAIALKKSIRRLQTNSAYRRALMLALISEIVQGASNVKFGPELYCGPAKKDASVLVGFESRVARMASDLRIVRDLRRSGATVVQGDSRKANTFESVCEGRTISSVICSPPYPTEHDYTRNSRLELAFLEEVYDLGSLRAIKKKMIRSHTKGIYVGDDDDEHVSDNEQIQNLSSRLERKVRSNRMDLQNFIQKS